MSTTRATKPRPDDKPFDFNLDAAEPPKELSPFVFNWHNRRWEMAHMETLDTWNLVAAAEGGEISAMTGVFRLALGKQWEDFRKSTFPQWQFRALFQAYREHCGINADGTPTGSSNS